MEITEQKDIAHKLYEFHFGTVRISLNMHGPCGREACKKSAKESHSIANRPFVAERADRANK